MMADPSHTDDPSSSSINERLQDPREHVRLNSIAQVLLAGSVSLPELKNIADCLTDPNYNVRRVAVEVLILYGPEGVPVLIKALDEGQPMVVRVAAASGLGRIGPPASPAVDTLCRSIRNDEDQLRWHSSFALAKIGAPGVPALQALLKSPDPKVILAAVDALEWIGENAKSAVEDLTQLALTPSTAQLQIACSSALVKITGDPSTGIPPLLSTVEQGDAETRKACIERMGNLGPLARESTSSLLERFQDENGEVRSAAALAVAKIADDPAHILPYLIKLLSDPELSVRTAAGMALAKFGPAASEALPALHVMQQESTGQLGAVANAAVEKIEKGG